jgi:hypothetical protein
MLTAAAIAATAAPASPASVPRPQAPWNPCGKPGVWPILPCWNCCWTELRALPATSGSVPAVGAFILSRAGTPACDFTAGWPPASTYPPSGNAALQHVAFN